MPYFEPKKAPKIIESKKKEDVSSSQKKEVKKQKTESELSSDIDREISEALGGSLDLGLDDRIDDRSKYILGEDEIGKDETEVEKQEEPQDQQEKEDNKDLKDNAKEKEASSRQSQDKKNNAQNNTSKSQDQSRVKIDREKEKEIDKQRLEKAKQERIKAHEEKASLPKKPLRSEVDKFTKQDKSNSSKQEVQSSARNVRNEFDIPVRETLNNDNPKISLAEEPLLMPVLNYPKPLDNVMKFKNKPKLNKIWCYHDEKRHQVIGHFAPGTGYVCTTRNDEKRWSLQPWVQSRAKKELHRTHLIPIGYHGSEADPRLVIMWDGEANTGVFKQFEAKQKRRNEPIYWFVDVRKTKYGATWKYSVYSAKTLKQLDVLVYEMKGKFMWRK